MIKHELFTSLPLSYQRDIMDHLIEINLKKGEPLFFEGDQALYIYYVKEGHIKVYKTSIDGNETIFNIYPQDSFIAAGVLFKGDKTYPASSSSVIESTVYAIPIQLLETAIIASGESAKRWMGYMNNRLTTVQTLLSDQIFADGLDRLKKLIHHFYENYPSYVQDKYIRIEIPVTKQEMAELLNIRRETLSRMLSALKNENICECTYKEIIVNKDWLLDYQKG